MNLIAAVMIARIWHGYTSFENADAYENLLKTFVFPQIEDKKVKGYRKITLLKRKLDREMEFITIMLFDNLDSVRDFAGENYEKSYVPDRAKQMLSHHDAIAQHYQITSELEF